MYNNWKIDLSDSVKAIEKIRLTVLPKLISGDIISIENTDDETLIMFDKYCGIDYLRKDDKGMQGVASRVQFGEKAWDSFTVRYQRHSGAQTEYEKRMGQIENGYFYPAFTLQAYFNNRTEMKLLSIAIIKTVDLYEIINKSEKVITRYSDNVFKVVFWDDIEEGKIKIHREPKKLTLSNIKTLLNKSL